MGSGQELNVIIIGENILKFINKQKKEEKIGILYNEYIKEFGEFSISYKTFQRYVQELSERELINSKKIIGGAYGSTTLVWKK